jgi:hypothetical protein
MNIKIFLLVIVALTLLAPSCSRKKSGDNANVEEIVMDDLSPEEREKILSRSSLDLRENPVWADNLSRIEITHDNSGIKIEKQFYNNLPSIKYIAVHTFANGTKQIIVYGQNGSVRSFSENVISQILKSSPDELTSEIPVYNNAENQASPGGITIKSLPPVAAQPQPAQTVSLPVQSTPAPVAAVAETPKAEKPAEATTPPEQPAAKPTPADTTSPQNLKKNLQIYSTKRPGGK